MLAELFDEPRFRAGMEEFNSGNFFEAHEVWEEYWNELVGEQRNLVQGLIQIAAAYLKLAQGNRSATRKLFDKAMVRLDAAGQYAQQPGVQRLLAVVRQQLPLLATGSPLEPPRFDL